MHSIDCKVVIVYDNEGNYGLKTGRSYPHTATEAAFLLGGIGTGNFSIGARGELRDWELFNRPSKGLKFPFSFFAIHCSGDDDRITRVLEAAIQPPFTQAHGFNTGTVAGLPHLRASRMTGEYPFCTVEFQDPELPVSVSLEAFTPFIPLEAEDSGLPGAYLRYRVENPTRKPLEVSIVGSLPNMIGFDGLDLYRSVRVRPGGRIERREAGGLRGLAYSSTEIPPDSLDHGELCLACRSPDLTFKPQWLHGGWFDGIQDLWDDFSADGRIEPAVRADAPGGQLEILGGRPVVGSVCATEKVGPGESRDFDFIITWYFPNRPRSWKMSGSLPASGGTGTIRNHYATRFAGAWDVGSYLERNRERLESLSRSFHRALFQSTLPAEVIDALAANITVIRSPTCFRLGDGTFASWEGCHEDTGSCEGSCTHVWNYAQTLAFLFPELQRSLQLVRFNLETEEDGRMVFRTHRIFGLPPWEAPPAADGQLGSIVNLYRDWKLSGDDELLRAVWPNAARALDFAFTGWDPDGDCVPEAEQHNTYDIEFYGPNPMISSLFYAALKAGAEMAAHLGDEARRHRWETAREKGSRAMDALLWNGQYYVQVLPDVDAYRYQHGQGCLSDQLFGQMLAHVAGLGYILPAEHVRGAIRAVYANNFLERMGSHENVQRTYALQDEPGLVLCTWPRGSRPRFPFVYCHEVWTGVEYQVAAHLVYEGFVDEGLAIVKAVRSRYDGIKRNPWDEVECGHHYVRSLASWALLPALSGYHYDLVEKRISFNPRVSADSFSCFFSTGRAWGIYRQKRQPGSDARSWEVEVLYGSLDEVTVNPEDGG